MSRRYSSSGGSRLLDRVLLWVFPLGAVLGAGAQETRWLRLDIPEWSVGTEIEGLTENVHVSGTSSTHDQFSVTPLVGLRTKGSIYHPNLLSFDVTGEGGYSWLTDTVTAPGYSHTRTEKGDLLRYLAEVDLLSGKPYNAFFSASQDHTYQNYDPFSTYTVDTTRYAGHLNWGVKNLTLNADLSYRDENSTGINGSTRFKETYANFSGIQTRDAGQSSLNYRYSEIDTLAGVGGSQGSTTHAVGVSDSEAFGSRRQISATTGAGYSQSVYSGRQTDVLSANESISITHRPDLDSFLNANYSHSQLSPYVTSYLQGRAGVRHRLYESLTSTFDVHGNHDESSISVTSASNSRFGLGLQEDYSKRLGDWGRLSLGAGVVVDHEDHESSGAVLPIIDERHDLVRTGGAIQPFTLFNPGVVLTTIQVRDSNGAIVSPMLYTTTPLGALTQITLQSDPSLNGISFVTVTYQSHTLYSAAFESFNGGVQIRLDILSTFGLYGRFNWLDNNAPPQAITQTLTDLVGGVDCTWRNMRLGAEFEDYDSNFVQYRAWRFFQSYNRQTTGGSTLGLDFSQNFYRYSNNLNQDRYQFISRYNALLTSSLAWRLEGGYALQTVMTTEQDFAFARTGLTWTRGKLSVRAGYEYNYQTTTTAPSPTEQRNYHHFYTYLKRSF